jgi:type II secretory pathway component GspD/PulD (secretin)
MLQPGQVTRRDDPATRPAEPTPGAQAENQPPEYSPPAEQPAAQPEQPAEPAAAQPAQGGDLFDQAMRFDAQRLLAEADAAFEAGRYNEAGEKYRQVAGPLRSYVGADEASRAEQRLAEVRVRLEQAGGNLLEQEQNVRAVRVEQARAEFDNFLSLARQRLASNETEEARSLASQARLRLAESRDLFPEDEYNTRISRQEALLQEIRTAEEASRQREADERTQRLAREAQQQESAQAQEKRRKINEALDRVRALQLEKKYKEALQVVDQILFLDPQDPAGLLLKDTLQDIVIYTDFEEIQRAKQLSYANASIEAERAMILPENLLDYPPDWPELSIRRGEPTAFSESAADRRVRAELATKRIPASFTDNTLEDVIEFIATVTNLNVDVDWDSLSDVGVNRDTRVSLSLQPLPAETVLNRVLEKVSPDRFSRANWAVNDGVLVIASDSALRKNTFIVIYDVRDLLYQIPSFTEFPQLDLDSVLNQQGGGGTGSIFQQTEQASEGDRLTRQELLDRLLEIIQTNVDFEGWRENGGDTGIVQELNDNLIITNTARNHLAISSLLRQLREVRSIQINVEARFLVVTQDFFEQIGFDLDVIFNAQNSQYDSAVQQQTQFLSAVTQQTGNGTTSLLPSDLTRPFFQGGSNRTFSVQELTEDITQTPSTFQAEATSGVVQSPDGWSMIPAQQGSKTMVENLIDSAFASEVLALNPALGIAGTFLDDIQVDFMVEATQADRRNVVLTAPRLTFTNGHAANIFVTTQQAFVSDLNPVIGTNSVAFDPQVDVVSSGFTLGLDGIVSADRRYVTLTIRTALAEVVRFDDAEVTAQTGGGTQLGAPSPPVTSSFQLPIVQVTSLSTGATIPDRGTLLVGGQKIKQDVEVESGVPVLSKLPIINRFFTNRIQSQEEQTLLILVKPTIIIQNEEEEKNFPGLLDKLQSGFGSGL